MKSKLLAATIFLAAVIPPLSAQAPALNGEPYIHDPSTIAFSRRQVFHVRHRRWWINIRRRLDMAQRRCAPRRRSGSRRH